MTHSRVRGSVVGAPLATDAVGAASRARTFAPRARAPEVRPGQDGWHIQPGAGQIYTRVPSNLCGRIACRSLPLARVTQCLGEGRPHVTKLLASITVVRLELGRTRRTQATTGAYPVSRGESRRRIGVTAAFSIVQKGLLVGNSGAQYLGENGVCNAVRGYRLRTGGSSIPLLRMMRSSYS